MPVSNHFFNEIKSYVLLSATKIRTSTLANLENVRKTNAFCSSSLLPFSGFSYAISTLVLEAVQSLLQDLSGPAEQRTLDDQKIYVAADRLLSAMPVHA